MAFVNEIDWQFQEETPIQMLQELSGIIKNWREEGVEMFLSGYFGYFDGMDEHQILAVYKWLKSWRTRLFKTHSKLNHHPTLFKQVAHIQFSRLRQLYLYGSSINNIEAIIFLDCPLLQSITINDNNIVEIKCLTKTNFPCLMYLIVDFYPITTSYQFAFISRVKFHPSAQYVMIHNEQNEERFHINQMVKCEPVVENFSNLVLASYYKLPEILSTLYPKKFQPSEQ